MHGISLLTVCFISRCVNESVNNSHFNINSRFLMLSTLADSCLAIRDARAISRTSFVLSCTEGIITSPGARYVRLEITKYEGCHIPTDHYHENHYHENCTLDYDLCNGTKVINDHSYRAKFWYSNFEPSLRTAVEGREDDSLLFLLLSFASICSISSFRIALKKNV